jgi:peroxiredoxin
MENRQVKKSFLVGVLITVLLTISGFTLVKLIEKGTGGKDRPSHLSVGESIDYFDLIDSNGERIDASVLKTKKPTLIFLFPRPCAPCSQDISFWSRMGLIARDSAQVFGVVVGTAADVRDFLGKKKIDFSLYFPGNLERFLEKMKIGSDHAQTLLCIDGKVEMVRFGVMDGESYTEFLKRTMALAQNGEKGGI